MHWEALRPSPTPGVSQGVRDWQDGVMKHIMPTAICAALAAALPFSAHAETVPTPPEIVAAAPASEWVPIAADDLLVIDLAPDAQGRARRVVIQLLPPPFATSWVGNIRKLAAAHWWDGLSINRAQDNYVVQWGDPLSDDKAHAKPLPPGLIDTSEGGYAVPTFTLPNGAAQDFGPDPYARETRIVGGWPVGMAGDRAWPLHCYGMVGVGRDNPPDAGSGAELYAVIGHAPRQLDRNIALVGRVIEGIEYLSTLPRGTLPLGFYASAAERVPIVAARIGSDVPGLPHWQMLSSTSASFARYAEARANRRDRFFVAPAGGVDACNVPVPVRRAP